MLFHRCVCTVDFLVGVFVVSFVVDEGRVGDFWGEGSVGMSRVAHRDAGDGDDVFRKLKNINELRCVVCDGSQPADAESERFGGHTGILCGDERVGNGPLVSLQVVVGIGGSVAALAVAVEAVEVGAEGEDERCVGSDGLKRLTTR